MFSHKRAVLWTVSVLIGCVFLLSACGSASAITTGSSTANISAASSKGMNVVAAENFYGNIVTQLGRSHVNVTSILSDPNIDPHEYTSNVQTAQKVSQADLVIENGLGYDDWMDKLLSASPNPNRIVVIGGKLADHPLPDNPHVWYGVNNMPRHRARYHGCPQKAG